LASIQLVVNVGEKFPPMGLPILVDNKLHMPKSVMSLPKLNCYRFIYSTILTILEAMGSM